MDKWRSLYLAESRIQALKRGGVMRYRIAGWASAGFLIAAFWAVYLLTAFHMPISRDIESAARLTCPIALVGEHYHFGVSLGWVLVSNGVVYGLLGFCLEPVWWLGGRTKPV
jgi:hypothetical protein